MVKIGRSDSSSPPLPPRCEGPAAAGLQCFSAGTRSWLCAGNSPSKKAKGFQSFQFPVQPEKHRSQQRGGRVPAWVKRGLGEERGGGKEGQGGWCHSWWQWQGTGLAQPWRSTKHLNTLGNLCTWREYFYSTFKQCQLCKKKHWMEISVLWKIKKKWRFGGLLAA